MTTKQEIDIKHNYRPFQDAPPTKEKISNILDLESIDLSQYQAGPEGLTTRIKLAKNLEDSLTHYGFFKIIGHGITDETFEDLKSITQSSFELSQEEKSKYLAGSYPIDDEKNRSLGVVRGSGFKPKGYWNYTDEIKDNVEFLNFRHFLHDDIFNATEYPDFVKAHLSDIGDYFKYLHYQVLTKVLTLIDIILELPEGTMFDKYFKVYKNDIIKSGGGFSRLLMYHETNPAYNDRSNQTWLRGHSDASALTFIVSQPILSLQIQDYETKEWHYASHTPGSLIVNVGDALQQITGGYFRSSIHRVHTAPVDQQNYKRTTAIYFCDPRLDSFIDPETLDSPKLNRLGIKSEQGWQRVTFSEWDDAKGKFLNQKSSTQRAKVKMFGRDSVMSVIEQPGSAKVH